MLDSKSHPLGEAARDWLGEMQACVRSVDYERAFAIFAEDVAAFGTFAPIVSGRENVQREQWSNVWPNITDFTFKLDDVRCIGDEHGVTVIVAWDSQGRRPDGSSYYRPGRATVVLQRREGRWLAVHTHFSLVPTRP